MSEQRFRLDYEEDDAIFIVEDDDIVYPIRNDTIKEYQLQKLVDKLNEQQATIQSLKSDKAIAEDYANIFEKENVKLRKQIGEQQATIDKLQDENEQLKNRLNDEYIKECSIK